MKIEPDTMPAGVKKTALCDVHMSPDSEWTPMMNNGDSSPEKKNSLSPEDVKAERRRKMRQARKILESRRKAS